MGWASNEMDTRRQIDRSGNGTGPEREKVLSTRRILIAVLLSFAILVAGNPGPGMFADRIVARLIQKAPAAPDTVVATIFPSVARALILQHTSRSNYFLFSVYRIDVGGSYSGLYLAGLWSIVQIHGSSPDQSDSTSQPASPGSIL